GNRAHRCSRPRVVQRHRIRRRARNAWQRTNTSFSVRSSQDTPRACSTSSQMSRRSSKAATPTETKPEGPTETDAAPSHDASLDMSLDMSLDASLRERIRREGSITFREWMNAALYDERRGYYRRRGAER